VGEVLSLLRLMEQMNIPEPLSTPKASRKAGLGSWGCFCCRRVLLPAAVAHGSLFFFFPSLSKMKRAGTTGSSRGMALYEEEVKAFVG